MDWIKTNWDSICLTTDSDFQFILGWFYKALIYSFSNIFKMKTLINILKVVIIPSMLYSSTLFAQIPNSGFEDWIDQGNYNNPDLWSSLNDMTEPAGVYTCTKGSPGNPGASYLKLTSKNVTGMGLLPGIAVSGELNTIDMQALSGFPFTGRPESISGNWKYMAYEGDQGYISILLTLWNPSSQSRDTIG